ncbi:hypothetical protein WH47_04086 [Habropoda laboriosa]|uniref:Tc1-like transposase DDE domain-containing protein n=1 Tax=Habropoda laboriosa TaxID=597456 RepID=A0A0L7QXN7_9HYME|nr:hypothetical protein WH47_04086 [Habropoda laboriosa]
MCRTKFDIRSVFKFSTCSSPNIIATGVQRVHFQQDGCAPHNARIVKEYLNSKFGERWLGTYGLDPLRNMTWPAQSPDLNPIEFLWEELDRNIRLHCPTLKGHLWQLL